MNTPNKLTLFRILMVFPFIALLFTTYHYKKPSNSIDYNNFSSISTITFFLAGLIFTIAMITDYIDGYLARKNNQITTFGKLFDPLADKIITTSALIMLSLIGLIPIYITLIFILRDILIDGFRNLAASKKIDVSASIYGKVKTMIMSIGISLVFIVYPFISKTLGTFSLLGGHYGLYLLNIPMYVSAILSIYSGYLYFYQIKKHITLK